MNKLQKPEVVLVEYYGPLRTYLRLLLSRAGYVVTPLARYNDALCHLRSLSAPAVVVVSNALPDHSLEATFFSHVVADTSLCMRCRYLLLTTTPESIPTALRAQLAHLDAPVITKPFLQCELVFEINRAAHGLLTAANDELADGNSVAGHRAGVQSTRSRGGRRRRDLGQRGCTCRLSSRRLPPEVEKKWHAPYG